MVLLYFISKTIGCYSTNKSPISTFLLPQITAKAVPAASLSGSPWRQGQWKDN